MTKNHLLYALLIIFLSIIFYSCQKDNIVDSEFPYEAEVIGKSLDCGDFEIKIIKGNQKVRSITGVNSDIYTAKNLSGSLKIEGIKIKLNIRKIKNTELTPCTTLGVPYPWVFVTNADAF